MQSMIIKTLISECGWPFQDFHRIDIFMSNWHRDSKKSTSSDLKFGEVQF